MQLLGTPGSPYVRKVRIVLEEKGIPHEYLIERPTGARVAHVNPLAKIPTLIRDDGRALYDSSVIIEYIDGLAPVPRLIPDAFEERIEVKRWDALGDGLADAALTIHHEQRKPEAKQSGAAFFERQQLKIDRALDTMNRDLRGRQFCFGERLTLADISVGYALGYLDYALPSLGWREGHDDLTALEARLALRPAFAKTVQTEWHY